MAEDFLKVLGLAHKALAAGGRMLSPTQVEWDVSGDCQNARSFTVTGTPWKGFMIPQGGPQGHWGAFSVFRDKRKHRLSVIMHVRCRTECVACLRSKRRMWTYRAITECNRAKRNWFGTLTIRPEALFVFLTRARLKQSACGVDYEGLVPFERFNLLVAEITPEISRFLKRVRKASGARLRYLLVAEHHKSGDPHFHILVHEVDGDVSKRDLDGAWHVGFSQFRLVAGDTLQSRNRAVAYVCKYISKSQLARTRASLKYGEIVDLGLSPGFSPGVSCDLPPR